MSVKRGFPWWIIAIGLALICIVCVGTVLVGGTALYFLQSPTPEDPLPPVVIVTEAPPPTELPPIPQATDAPPMESAPFTGAQEKGENYLIDDFSTKALGWPEFNDGTTIIRYEDMQYSIQITEPDYYDWAFIPVDFKPFEISFDVVGLPGAQNGTFGVFCQYQDEDNQYYVEFDLETRSYIIGEFVDGEDIPLTGNSDNPWQVAGSLKTLPNEPNHIDISCYRDFINLFVNNEWVTEVNIQQPFGTDGNMAFFVYTFDFVNSSGYKIYFDNVEVYRPVQ